jgi:hypothetical protein
MVVTGLEGSDRDSHGATASRFLLIVDQDPKRPDKC